MLSHTLFYKMGILLKSDDAYKLVPPVVNSVQAYFLSSSV